MYTTFSLACGPLPEVVGNQLEANEAQEPYS